MIALIQGIENVQALPNATALSCVVSEFVLLTSYSLFYFEHWPTFTVVCVARLLHAYLSCTQI